MTNLIDYIRPLGEAIVSSPEYKTLQIAEANFSDDPAYQSMHSRLLLIESLIKEAYENGDYEKAAVHEKEADEIKALITELPSVSCLSDARMAFSALMTQVNNVLQFTITG